MEGLTRETGMQYGNALPDVQIMAHKARFGEIEARGIALTQAARQTYDDVLDKADAAAKGPMADALASNSHADTNALYQGIALPIFRTTNLARRGYDAFGHLIEDDSAYFTFQRNGHHVSDELADVTIALLRKYKDRASLSDAMSAMVEEGAVARRPVVYEDFLPKSAAGIFKGNQSNHEIGDGAVVVRGRLDLGTSASQAMAAVNDPKIQTFMNAGIAPLRSYNLYAAQEAQSIRNVFKAIGVALPEDVAKMLDDRISLRTTRMYYAAPNEIGAGAEITSQPPVEKRAAGM